MSLSNGLNSFFFKTWKAEIVILVPFVRSTKSITRTVLFDKWSLVYVYTLTKSSFHRLVIIEFFILNKSLSMRACINLKVK